jgi:endoglucanase
MVRNLAALSLSICFAIGAAALSAEASLAPPEIPGKAVYAPFPVAIALDGNIDDWAGVPLQTVDRGPSKSKDPAENGSFSFAVAADADSLYVLMLAKDKNIITNMHKADTWNEDSMEFYFNLGSDLFAKKYSRDMAQYRFIPADIGNAELEKIGVSGNNVALFPPKAKIFKTPDGWGLEAAVKIGPKNAPAHGKEIGFQAQMNGASKQDRDVKLIWSLADSSDNSWQNPSLFGRAIFFKVGSSDIPLPSDKAPPPPPVVKPDPLPPPLSMNQVGYFPKGRKLASYSNMDTDSLPWSLMDANTEKKAASGVTSPGTFDLLSGDSLHVADFSSFKKSGDYYLVIGEARSPVFSIGDDILKSLSVESLKYFYRSRSGIALKREYAGKTWAREAGHLTDAKVPVFEGVDAQGRKWEGYDYYVNGSGGWYDAGDYGKYVVNGGISVWTLQNAYERKPAAFADGQLSIPESGNGNPDILDEARWELEFMLNMQIPAGKALEGMCFHKLHDRKWAPMPCDLPSEYDNNLERKDGCETGRFAYQPTTAATLNLAACAAQASRIWAPLDKAFAARCLAAARTAWKAAREHPALLAGNVPGDGGGNYDDGNVADEFFWAAAELLAATGDQEYLGFLKSSPYWSAFPGLERKKANSMTWADTAALGAISLVSAPSKLAAADRAALAAQVIRTADRYLDEASRPGYGAPMGVAGYVWGSNSGILNNALVLAVAYDETKKAEYRDAVAGAMDYLLGYNGSRKSFITGFGANPVLHPHHRLWANDPASGYVAPPPGVVAGGPDKNVEDPEMRSASLNRLPIAKRYLDTLGSFATNEVCINWNAPLAWVANWLDSQYGRR